MHVIITVGGRRREQHDLATATRENQALQRARGLVWVDGRSYSHSLSLWGVHQCPATNNLMFSYRSQWPWAQRLNYEESLLPSRPLCGLGPNFRFSVCLYPNVTIEYTSYKKSFSCGKYRSRSLFRERSNLHLKKFPPASRKCVPIVFHEEKKE